MKYGKYNPWIHLIFLELKNNINMTVRITANEKEIIGNFIDVIDKSNNVKFKIVIFFRT